MMVKIVGVLFKELEEDEYDEKELERCMTNALQVCDWVYAQGKLPLKYTNVTELHNLNREELLSYAKSTGADWLIELNVKCIFSMIGVNGGVKSICKKIMEQEIVEYKYSDKRTINISTKMINYILFHISYLYSSHNLCRGHDVDKINDNAKPGDENFYWYGHWKPLLIRNKPELDFSNCVELGNELNKNIITPIEVLNFKFENAVLPAAKNGFKLHVVHPWLFPRTVLDWISDEKIWNIDLVPYIADDEDINIVDPFKWKQMVVFFDKIGIKMAENLGGLVLT